jgi:hypothetical protein
VPRLWGHRRQHSSTTCSGYLLSHASCTVTIAFAPLSNGPAAGSLSIAGVSARDGAALAATLALGGNGTSGAALAFPDGASVDFGSIAPAGSVDRAIVLSNRGNADANSLMPKLDGSGFAFKGGTYPGTGGTCAGYLSTGTDCTMIVSFSSTTRGSASGSLQLGFTDGGSQANGSIGVMLGASVTTGALLTIAGGPSVDLGQCAFDHPIEHVFTVTNVGVLPASHIVPEIYGYDSRGSLDFKGSAYPGAGGTCGDSLDVGASCSVVLTLKGTGQGITHSTLVFKYDTGESNTLDITATMTSGITFEIVEAPSFDYGVQLPSTKATHTFTVRNTGVNDAILFTPKVTGDSFSFASGFLGDVTCNNYGLNAGDSCTVEISFSSATPGTGTGSFSISDDAFGASATVKLVGTASWLYVSPSINFDFGEHLVGSKTDHLFYINNGSRAPLGFSVDLTGSGYSYVGGGFPGTGGNCVGELIALDQCHIAVEFKPGAVGAQTGALTITDDAGLSQAIALTGKGL